MIEVIVSRRRDRPATTRASFEVEVVGVADEEVLELPP